MNSIQFVEYMNKQAGPGYTDDTIKAAKGIYGDDKPGALDALKGRAKAQWQMQRAAPSAAQAREQGNLISSSDAGLSMDQLKAKRERVARVDKPFRAQSKVSLTTPAQSRYTSGVASRMGKHLGKEDSTFDKFLGWATGSQNRKATEMDALLKDIKANPDGEAARQAGFTPGSLWNPSTWGSSAINRGIVDKSVAANIPAAVKQQQQEALAAFWAKNKEWLIAAGIGVGGLGLLLTTLMMSGGQQQAQQQQQQPQAPSPWWANKNFRGYNFRGRA